VLPSQQRGITSTFRVGADVETATGPELVSEHIVQVLGTRVGELPWRPTFGSRLHTLLFLTDDAVLDELARQHVLDAVGTWLPSVQVVSVATSRPTPEQIEINVGFRLRATGTTGTASLAV
jgi:hypothetical protein